MNRMRNAVPHADEACARGTRNAPARVLVLADHPSESMEILKRLEISEGVSFVSGAEPAVGALSAIERIQPDIVLLDLHADDMDPLFLIKSIRAKFPNKPLLLFSHLSDPLFAARVLRAGAHGYLMKTDVPQNMIKAIRELLKGGTFVSEKPMQGILHALANAAQAGSALPVQTLTDRELVIFRFLGRGQDVYQIAAELNLNVKTVLTHRYNIKKKLNLPRLEDLPTAAQEWARTEEWDSIGKNLKVDSG